MSASGAETLNDVRVLIDVSGSMKQNDPDNLRIPALELLVELLPAGTRAGIWTFGRYVNAQVPLGTVDPGWRQRARKGAKLIHSRGLFTNIEDALERATADWIAPHATTRRSVILLTDGMVDVSKVDAESEASRQRIIEQTLPRLKRVGGRVHTIALSPRADHALMRSLAEVTGGGYERADESEKLQRLFLHMLERAAHPNALPLQENRFTVDDSIRELTLLVFLRDKAREVQIGRPDGVVFGEPDKPTGVEWRRAEGYNLVTIREPMPGEWRVEAELDPDNRVMVVTDLRLHATELPESILPGRRLQVGAHLTQQGKQIRDKRFLDVVKIEVVNRTESGESRSWELVDDGSGADQQGGDGLFSAALGDLTREGRHQLVIRASGGTFTREHRQRVSVMWPFELSLKPKSSADLASYALIVEPLADLMEPGSLEVSARIEHADATDRPVELLVDESHRWRAEITDLQAGVQHLKVRLSGRAVTGDLWQLELGPFVVEGAEVVEASTPNAMQPSTRVVEESPLVRQPNWVFVGASAVGANVVVLGGLAIAWRWRRRKSAQELEALSEAA